MKLPFDHFNLIARWYDRLIPRVTGELMPLLTLAPGQKVLDIGGGTGRVSQHLADLGAHVVVCDLAEKMLRQASAKGLTAVLASVEALPFAAGSVEHMLVVDAFHHFTADTASSTQTRAVFELLRVLSLEGRLVIEEPDIRRTPAKVIALGEKLLMMGSRFLSPSQMIAMFQAAGARMLTVDESGFSVRLVFTR